MKLKPTYEVADGYKKVIMFTVGAYDGYTVIELLTVPEEWYDKTDVEIVTELERLFNEHCASGGKDSLFVDALASAHGFGRVNWIEWHRS